MNIQADVRKEKVLQLDRLSIPLSYEFEAMVLCASLISVWEDQREIFVFNHNLVEVASTSVLIF